MSPPLKIGITMGDPTGVGPETIIKALNRMPDRNWTPVVIGIPEVFEWTRGSIAQTFDYKTIEPEQLGAIEDTDVYLIPIESPCPFSEIEIGVVCKAGGEAAWRAIEQGIRLCLAGELDTLCTAPLHKAALQQAGHLFPGHTEILKTMSHSKLVAMCLDGGGLRTVPLTGHMPLRQVPARITEDAVFAMIQLLYREIPLFGVDTARIGVTGVNPHAGDMGALGSEDDRFIRPAIERARHKKMQVDGPIPGDVAFRKMLDGHYDVILAMYHDQALIPVKTLGFDEGVNITLGLPFIRTSPDHGTAHDIAGSNTARPDSMISALNMAVRLTENKNAKKAAT